MAADNSASEKMQSSTFTKWCNYHLKDRDIEIQTVLADFKSGVNLVQLVEIISGKTIGRYNKTPKMKIHEIENNSKCLQFLMKSEGITLVNMGGDDIVEGNRKIILGLIWTLILRYQIQKGGQGEGSAKNELLEWVRSKIGKAVPGYGYDVNNFTTDWNDGKKIMALVNACGGAEGGWLCPNHATGTNPLDNARNGLTQALEQMDCPMLISAEDMTNPMVDELAMMTYISALRDAERRHGTKPAEAGGPGIQPMNQANIAGQECHFHVDRNDAKGPVEVKVIGPDGKPQPAPKCTDDNNDGTFAVTYVPTGPGDYKVLVTVGGKPVDDMPPNGYPVKIFADAGNARCYGPGLEEAVENQPAQFNVDTSKCVGGGTVKCWVEGPPGAEDVPVVVKRNANNIWDVEYKPSKPGLYIVNVTLDDIHVPGSPFTVTVEGGPLLGGGGKIQIYFTTTTSNAKTRKDQNWLQRLLESREIHLRDDWVPWIPLDLIPPKEKNPEEHRRQTELRDNVYLKAGTKVMPVMFINDQFVGGIKEIAELEASGKLYILFDYNKNKKAKK